MKPLSRQLLPLSSAIILCALLGVGCSSNAVDPLVDETHSSSESESANESNSANEPDSANEPESANESNSANETDSANESGEEDSQNGPSNTNESNAPEQGQALPTIENAALIFIAEEKGALGLAVTAHAQFYSITTPLINEPALKDMPTLDTCEVSNESSQINADALALPIDHLIEASGSEILQVKLTSAGDTAEFISSDGSFVSLEKNDEEGSVHYRIQDGSDLTTLTPATLSVSVAGDVFPSLSSDWVTPDRLSESLRDDFRFVQNDPLMRWTAAETSEQVQSRIHFYAGFIDEQTGIYSSYSCVVEDDGEFLIPDNALALYEDGVSPNFVDVARYHRSLSLVDGISVVNVYLQKF